MTKILTALTFAVALGLSMATASAGADDNVGGRHGDVSDLIVQSR